MRNKTLVKQLIMYPRLQFYLNIFITPLITSPSICLTVLSYLLILSPGQSTSLLLIHVFFWSTADQIYDSLRDLMHVKKEETRSESSIIMAGI